MKTKIEIGTKVFNIKGEAGIITKVITKSTGYVEVDFNGSFKKEMAFNLKDESGVFLKNKPVKKELTSEQRAKLDRSHSRFMSNLNNAVLKGNFLDCQIKSGNYNVNLID